MKTPLILFLFLAACLTAIPAFSAAPAIATNGVKNVASYADPQLPNGAIAEGSIFTIFGSNMGPAVLAYASGLPLPTTLSGTSVSVTVTGSTVACFLFYTSAGQVAAILPSTTPVGRRFDHRLLACVRATACRSPGEHLHGQSTGADR